MVNTSVNMSCLDKVNTATMMTVHVLTMVNTLAMMTVHVLTIVNTSVNMSCLDNGEYVSEYVMS